MVYINVKKYEHMNKSFPNWDTKNGKYVSSKAHYEQLKQHYGMMDSDKAREIAEKAKEQKKKPYILSDKAKEVIEAAKQSSKNGKLKMSDKLIDGMKEVGVNFDVPEGLNPNEGGFKE